MTEVDKTKYNSNKYFRVLYDCTLFAVNVKKNDLLCFNSKGWRIVDARYRYSYVGGISEVSTDVLTPVKKNELRNLNLAEEVTR